MSSHELFVVLTRVLGLYVLTGTALYDWATVVAGALIPSKQLEGDAFTYHLVYALIYSVVGLFLLIFAEQVTRFAEARPKSSVRDESDPSTQPDDGTAT